MSPHSFFHGAAFFQNVPARRTHHMRPHQAAPHLETTPTVFQTTLGDSRRDPLWLSHTEATRELTWSHPDTYREQPGNLSGILWVLPRAPETNRELRWNLLRLDRNVSETFPECLTRCLRRVSGTTATTCCFRGVLDSLRDLSDSIPRPFRQLALLMTLCY